MNYKLVKDVIDLIQQFEVENPHQDHTTVSIPDFKKWITRSFENNYCENEPEWVGKEKGRSPESVISTLIVNMNRYAKSYSRAAIDGSDFSSQEDFIYLINLKAFGAMSKMDLIKKNVHEKPVGMQIINRLIKQNWVEQTKSETDRRSKFISITLNGLQALEKQMDKIRRATQIVTGNLEHSEKMELIRLLSKLNDFHLPIYDMGAARSELLNVAYGRID